MKNLRTLQENGKTFVLLPIDEYERLIGGDKDASDIAAFDAAVARGEESFPITIFDAIDAGKNPIAVFREYRNLNQAELARKAQISKPFVSQIESGIRVPSFKVHRAIAEALNVPIDMLIYEHL